MKDSAYYKDLAAKYLTPNYGVREIVLTKGSGARVWDADGREYLDFLAGISVCNLGHCPKVVVDAVAEQLHQLIHCSNLYLIPQQAELAARLCELSFAERCFFANSGAEMNEGAIKLARLYAKKKVDEKRFEIITLKNSFHGRTIATITATGQEKVQKGFEPLVEGFRYAELNDIESVRAQINDKTCAIMLEPVQGEGGIRAATTEFLKALREECTRRKLLLIFDEIQSGLCRCGKLFAYELSGVEPDILTLAKSLGSGYPVGALLTRAEIAEVLQPGTHGTTFGGNPPACVAALASINEMVDGKYADRATRIGEFFVAELKKRIGEHPWLKEIRCYGAMIGVELTNPGADVVKGCVSRGLLINCTMNNILRLLPPLVVTEEECTKAAGIIAESLIEAAGKSKTETAGCACAGAKNNA